MTFQIRLPETIVFGPGSFGRMGELAEKLGGSALLCTGKTALRKSGRLEQALDLLEQRNLSVVLFEGIENDPSLTTCNRAITAARENNCDFVIGIGGGSAMDAAKAAAAIIPQDGTLEEYFAGDRELENQSLPLLAVPTTAGTGTECTINAVLTDTVHNIKKSLRADCMMPAVALVDPDLTLGCPPDITAQSGMDALTQAIECYVTAGANPVTDALALRAIELLASQLPHAVKNPDNPQFREPVALGSLLGGMAFGNAGLGAVHGLAHPIGVRFHAPHGLICAVLLPHVCAFNLPVRENKFGGIAPLIGAQDASGVPAALTALNRRVGIPDTLAQFGIMESDLPAILAHCRSGSMKSNPRTAADDDLAKVLRQVI